MNVFWNASNIGKEPQVVYNHSVSNAIKRANKISLDYETEYFIKCYSCLHGKHRQ